MAVRRGERQLCPLDLEEDAGQHRPRFVGGGRHLGLLHRPQHVVEGNLEPVPLLGSRAGWELLRLDALDVGVEPSTAEAECLGLKVELERQLLVGKG